MDVNLDCLSQPMEVTVGDLRLNTSPNLDIQSLWARTGQWRGPSIWRCRVENVPGRISWLAGLLLTGCATVCPPPTTADGSAGLSAERRMLSEGYSILDYDAEVFSRARLILYTKIETDEFDDLITAVSAFGSKLHADLKRIDRDYPGVHVGLDPLPELEKRKRRATAIDKALKFVPVVGESGAQYERTVLISLANGMNQERHLVMELTDAETDAGLKDFLRGVQVKMDALYERAENLLRKYHYRNASAR